MLRQTPARLIFLYGVLAGLFFSGGEGIQLMPFPVAAEKSSKIAASSREENSKSYAFSLFSSRSSFSFLKSKFQKADNQYLSGAVPTIESTQPRADYYLAAAQSFTGPGFLRHSPVPNSKSNRAPPAV